MELKDILINTVLLSSIVLCMLTFSVFMGSNYNQTSQDMTSNAINIQTVEQNLNDTNNEASIWHSNFLESIPLIGVGIVILQTLWHIGNLISNSVIGTINLFTATLSTIFGVPSIIIDVISTIAIISLIIAVYKFYRSGD
jgi:hypothetical protein